MTKYASKLRHWDASKLRELLTLADSSYFFFPYHLAVTPNNPGQPVAFEGKGCGVCSIAGGDMEGVCHMWGGVCHMWDERGEGVWCEREKGCGVKGRRGVV